MKKWWKTEQPEPASLAVDGMEFRMSLWDAPDGLKAMTLKPTAPFAFLPRIGEEVTVTLRVIAIEREER